MVDTFISIGGKTDSEERFDSRRFVGRKRVSSSRAGASAR
jgi:hypothetical protein